MSRAQRPPSDIFDAGQALISHTNEAIEILERAMQGAPQERRDLCPVCHGLGDYDDPRTGNKLCTSCGKGTAAPAAPNNILGPRTPCRVCGDLTFFGVHDRCAPLETRAIPQSLLDRWDEQDRKIHDREAGRDEGDADASQSPDETEP